MHLLNRAALCLGVFCGVLAVHFPAHAGAVDTPINVYASLGVQQSGIFIGWDPVNGATGYQIARYADLFTNTRISTTSITAANSFYLDTQPCGVAYYFEVYAKIDAQISAPSARVLGYSPPCGAAMQSCDFEGIPISGTGDYTFTTVGSLSNYRIGDRSGACSDGNDPGTAGVGPDQVFTYVSPVNCTLTVTLNAAYQANLYIAETCEVFACDYFSFVPGGAETITLPVIAGQTYYIFVDGYNTDAAGEYTLSLTSGNCTPAASCADVSYDFQNDALPQGWTALDADLVPSFKVGRYAFQAWGVIEDLSGSVLNRVAAAYADPAIGADTDDWLIAGPFNIDSNAELIWRDARVGTGGTVKLDVYVAGAYTSVEDFLNEGPVATFDNSLMEDRLTERSVALAEAGFADQTIYVAFRHRANSSGFLLVDDIGICGYAPATHTVDQNADFTVSLSELLRVIQFYNSAALHCQAGTEDGFAPNIGDTNCAPHQSDYSPQNWVISLSELLRVIQFYNTGAYRSCAEGEDGYCPGAA